MRVLRLWDKFVFFLNVLAATVLLLSFILPFIEPKKFAFLSVLSLTVPFLIIINVIFVIYWLLKVKRQLLLSGLILAAGYTYLGSLYKFSASKLVEDADNITVINYNVRLFNLFKWIPQDDIPKRIETFIFDQQADIISFQEYRKDDQLKLKGYYKYEELAGDKIINGQAIYSKFPIINKGSIQFPNTYNNAIFADVVKGKDTLRIYNLHLQSLKLDTSPEGLKKSTSERAIKGVGETFRLQQEQTALFMAHRAKSPYKTIICGDFNNTAYSYVYKTIKKDMVDAFEEAGNGFGRSFDFKFFPIRIDFILTDRNFEINSFKTFDLLLSDHYPIMSRIKIKS